jgi:fimbrial chaperone protein
VPGFHKYAPALLAVVALILSPLVADAVLVAPHAIFMDQRTRTGEFTIANPGKESEEVDIALEFGYPATDSTGNPYVLLVPSPSANQPSAAAWIQAYPRRVRLAPGQRQVIRLLATPPANLPDGEYWSRVIVTSRHSSVAPIAADSGLQAGLTFELRTIIGLIYRKGPLHTAVHLQDVHGSTQRDSLVVWTTLQREGDAAYLGSLHVWVADHAGRMTQEWHTPVAVYYGIRRRLALPLAPLPPGHHMVHVEVTTAREDLPQQNVLPAPAVADSFAGDNH